MSSKQRNDDSNYEYEAHNECFSEEDSLDEFNPSNTAKFTYTDENDQDSE